MMPKSFVFSVLICCVFIGILSAEQQVTVVDHPGFLYASMEFKGSYDQMAVNIQTFIQEFFKQGLTPMGELTGIYFNATGSVPEADLKWAIAFPINRTAEVTPPLQKREFPARQVAKYLHVGPYTGLGEAYQKIFDFLKNNHLQMEWPTFDRYLNNPMQVKPEDLKTEILVPVKESQMK